MNNNNYSYLVQALHHLVLGNRFIPELLHDIEKFIYKKKIKDYKDCKPSRLDASWSVEKILRFRFTSSLVVVSSSFSLEITYRLLYLLISFFSFLISFSF